MKKIIIATFIAAPIAFQVNAGELNYNFLQATYVSSDTNISGVNVDGNGFAVSLSKEISPNIAFVGGIDNQSFDFGIDTNSFSFGVNYHSPINEKSDFIIGFNVLNAEVSVDGFGSEDDTGNIISIGMRNNLQNNMEFSWAFQRTDIFDDSSTSFSLGILIGLENNFQVGFGYSSGDDTDSIGFFGRANF